MPRGVESEELLDRGGIGEVNGILSPAGKFFEAAEKEDLYANCL